MNQDIFGALKSALSREYSLEIAKQTLINSGYSIQEINEVISALQEKEPSIPEEINQQQIIPSFSETQLSQQLQQTSQKTSAYENVKQKQQKDIKEKGTKIFIITLIIILTVLLGVLIAFFIFKEQLTGIFS